MHSGFVLATSLSDGMRNSSAGFKVTQPAHSTRQRQPIAPRSNEVRIDLIGDSTPDPTTQATAAGSAPTSPPKSTA